MSRKSGYRFSEKDMRKLNNLRAHPDSTRTGCALMLVDVEKRLGDFSIAAKFETEAV